MRLVTWNCCRGRPALKLPRLLDTQPDIAVVQECPQVVEPGQVWAGENPRQGLLAIGREGYRLRRSRSTAGGARFFLPVRVTGPAEFNILAVWAQPGNKAPRYVNTLFQGIEAHRRFIDSRPTVFLGDLNSAHIPSTRGSHLRFVEMLRDRHRLVSAYHAFHKIEHGAEGDTTYYHLRHRDKPYHIDYVFVPETWANKIARVTVGAYDDWRDLSDHMPVWVDIEIPF